MAQRMTADEEIQRLVLEELKWDPEIEPTDVGMEVDDGVVTLTGTVESYPMKLAAERAAHRAPGVKAVANDIQVKLPFERVRGDTDIAAAASNALAWDTQVPSDRIKITVRAGWVTLEGNVDWHFQRDAAERMLRNMTGVKGVANLVTVGAPEVSPELVKSQIEAALERGAELDARRITVEVHDGMVTLVGIVRSWFERAEAEKAVWAVEGVTEVDNRITVAS